MAYAPARRASLSPPLDGAVALAALVVGLSLVGWAALHATVGGAIVAGSGALMALVGAAWTWRGLRAPAQ